MRRATLVATLALLASGARAQYFSVQEVPLTARHTLYDSFNGKVYASIPAGAASNPNTVAQIDAATGAVEAYLPAGSDPDALALSSDGQYLYVGLDGVSAVARISLTTNLVDQQFSLGVSPFGTQYPYHAGSIVPLPGLPQSVAVGRSYFGVSPSSDGIVIYDNGVQRPNVLSRNSLITDTIAASNSPNRLYSLDSETSGETFAQINVDANGLSIGGTSDSFGTNIIGGAGVIKFDAGNGLIYASNGAVADPQALKAVGTYPGLTYSDLTPPGQFPARAVDVVPNSQENRVYFLTGSTDSTYSATTTLKTYDLAGFQQVSSFIAPGAYLSIGDLSEISPSAFVFRSGGGVELLRAQAITSVAATPSRASLSIGLRLGLRLTATLADGSTADVTAQAAWSSLAPGIASVDALGVVTANAPGQTLIAGSFGGQTATAAVTVPDPHAAPGATHVLWDKADGTASVWNYLPADGTFTHAEYGPYSGWTAKAVAGSGADGAVRLLWNRTDDTMSLWSLDNAAGLFTQFTYGPYAGWTAQALSVGAGNSTHILWTNTDGRATVWNYDTATGGFAENAYGPYAGWTARAIADGGAGGSTRLLWNNADGRAALWSLDTTAGGFTHNEYGPFPGWTASALSVGTDGTAHLLWDNADGRASVWNQKADDFGSFTQNTYGPYAGWSARSIADGPDGRVRLLWDRTDGAMSLWSLDNAAGLFTQFTYGPYAGWTALGVSAGH